MRKSVHALVLAAGLSSRMGSPKQLLSFGEKTVLQTVVDVLLQADLGGIHVVVGHRAEEIADSLANRKVACIRNADYQSGMLSSIQAGLGGIPDDADAVLVTLGDQPQLSPDVVARILSAYEDGDRGIIVPVYGGKRGHPVILDLGRYRMAIFDASPNQGLKPVVRGYPEDTLEVDISDEGILRDIDTLTDYQNELDRKNADS